MPKTSPPAVLLDLAADIVSAYVTRNAVTAAELPDLIRSVHGHLTRLSIGESEQDVESIKLEPAVSIKTSVTDEYIICLEDGKRLRTMKRYLSRVHNLSPDQYRAKWGLPRDYPMTAPGYSQKRSEAARKNGLGMKQEGEAKPRRKKKAA